MDNLQQIEKIQNQLAELQEKSKEQDERLAELRREFVSIQLNGIEAITKIKGILERAHAMTEAVKAIRVHRPPKPDGLNEKANSVYRQPCQ